MVSFLPGRWDFSSYFEKGITLLGFLRTYDYKTFKNTLTWRVQKRSVYSVCRVCFSLNKSTFYLSLCLSLNSFCNVIVDSHSVSDSLWPHGLQHTRLPCLSPFPGACSNSCPLSQWCYPTVSSSVAHFSSCPQSFPALGSFPMSQLFTSGGQSIGPSSSTSVLPTNIQGLFPLGLTGLLSLQSKGCSRVFSSTTVQKHQFFSAHPL